MECGKVTDEIKQYLVAHHVGAYEAIWRLMRHEIHHQQPAVVDLSVHLQNEQLVLFDDEALPKDVIIRADRSKSKLMASLRPMPQMSLPMNTSTSISQSTIFG